jgi:hypothetical protein
MLNLENESLLFKSNEAGDATGEFYEGIFEVRKVLTPAQKSMADFERRAFLGNPAASEDIDPQVAELAFAIGQIKARVVKGPKWFHDSNGLKNFLDQNVMIQLANEILEVELKFKKDLKEKAEQAKAALAAKV